MKNMQNISKTTALLAKIAQQDIIREEKLLSDPGLQELFSWRTARSPRARLKDTLAVLLKQGDITQGSLGNDKIFQITEAGRTRLHRPTLTAIERPKPSSWNRRWYFITYQIPDSHKSARNHLIIQLHKLGAQRFSAALWICPYDIGSEVKKIATYYKVAQYIDYLRADSITQVSHWRKQFKL